MKIDDLISVVNSEDVAALCLSKGGWEGWLQCQLWAYLSLEKAQEVEREVSYPNSKKRCDLVVHSTNPDLWVELKAYGIFREGDANKFLDSIANDVYKLENRPNGTNGLVIVVVPNAIAESFNNAIIERKWNGFSWRQAQYATIFYMNLN